VKTWEKRARNFTNLQWAGDRLYLSALIKAAGFSKTDIVLDVGTGTGIVAHAISPLVKQVVGLDKSPDMLKRNVPNGNVRLATGDIRKPGFEDGVFDKAIARHVFHHITSGTQLAMNQCYRVLKKEGLMVLSEGVPPSPEVKQDYIEIFKLKEKRLTFMEEDLVALMARAGFENIRVSILWLRKMSVRNWLANSGVPPSTQNRIFELHVNAQDYFKKAYGMVEADGDCLIDMKMAILVGQK